ncbi:MAG: glycerophosphodiester phosphodiesterase [Acidimicrobiales bacterium]
MTRVFAHRGRTEGVQGHPENTAAAFAAARRLGCDGVELDVRRTADGALVVHHDAEVPGAGPLHSITRHELPPHVPLLSEALEACDGMVVNVEIKATPGGPGEPAAQVANRATAALTAVTLLDLGWADRVIVSSFETAILETVGQTEPTLALGWLLEWNGNAAAGLRFAAERGWQAIHPFVTQVDSTLVDAAHQAGLAVHAWTVNAHDDLVAMAELGADAVITDRPGEALAIMRSRPGPQA